MGNVALIIIYNHKFIKNIELLEELYKKRFQNIFHLVPFYNGEKENVIPVYDNSFYFQGYVAQGLKSYYREQFDHYFFIADDMVLNPLVNENNYHEYMNITPDASFIPDLVSLHECKSYWERIPEAVRYMPTICGVEINGELPSYNEALLKFKQHNLTLGTIPFDQVFKKEPLKLKQENLIYFLKRNFNLLKNRNKNFNLSYPLVGSYSDIFVISKSSIKQFCHYCGIFAVTKLFIELAVPTALVLSSDKIITEKESILKGKALWTKEDYEIIARFDNNLNNLLDNFPEGLLYIHPIKLSKWTMIS